MFNYYLEKRLAPICIDKERSYQGNYGTRTHTIILVDQQNQVFFAEIDRYKQVSSSSGQVEFMQGHYENVFEFCLSP